MDMSYARLRWSRGSVLAFGTQVRGFKPSDLKKKKNPQHAFLRRESKAVGRRFAACKRSLQLRGNRIVDEIVGIFLAHEEFHLTLLGVSRVVGREGT
jgi:ribosomal protein L34